MVCVKICLQRLVYPPSSLITCALHFRKFYYKIFLSTYTSYIINCQDLRTCFSRYKFWEKNLNKIESQTTAWWKALDRGVRHQRSIYKVNFKETRNQTLYEIAYKQIYILLTRQWVLRAHIRTRVNIFTYNTQDENVFMGASNFSVLTHYTRAQQTNTPAKT